MPHPFRNVEKSKSRNVNDGSRMDADGKDGRGWSGRAGGEAFAEVKARGSSEKVECPPAPSYSDGAHDSKMTQLKEQIDQYEPFPVPLL